MSDNSHYSIVKELLLLSTKRRNFSIQFGRRLMLLLNISLPSFESSSYEPGLNRQSAIADRQCPGGGEGIRTPDPRVANAVLCQLSYTPDKHLEIRISK